MFKTTPVLSARKKKFSPRQPYELLTTNRPGRIGEPVVAPVSGTIRNVVTGRKPGQAADNGKTIREGISGNGCEIVLPSKERVILAHLSVKAGIKGGSKVKAGEVIGYTDRSGVLPAGPALLVAVADSSGELIDPETWNSGEEETGTGENQPPAASLRVDPPEVEVSIGDDDFTLSSEGSEGDVLP